MEKAIIIFNGLQPCLPLADRAFDWARISNGGVMALFLKTRHETKEGYGFPSDYAAAETISTREQAEAQDDIITQSNIRLLIHQAANQHITFSTAVLNDPTSDELQSYIAGSAILFMDDSQENSPVAGVDIKKLLDNNRIPVEKIQ
jgi:hypothetical protein